MLAFCLTFTTLPSSASAALKGREQGNARFGNVVNTGQADACTVLPAGSSGSINAEEEAREYAESIISKLDLGVGQELKDRALDAKSYGVKRQKQMRDQSSGDGYVEPHLWTGIGKARSGCEIGRAHV